MFVEPLDHHHDNGDALPWILESSLRCHPARPLVGADLDSAWVRATAVSDLAAIRCPVFDVTDALYELHETGSLLRQGRAFVPDVVEIQSHPIEQEHSWSEIAANLEVTPAVAERRYRSR